MKTFTEKQMVINSILTVIALYIDEATDDLQEAKENYPNVFEDITFDDIMYLKTLSTKLILANRKNLGIDKVSSVE